ncbi:DUF5694 domain-containing protein [Flavobacterium paronense]|uniref:DUF5694 domain-containing protein n=1 Tax=Flavobacterium paronense TaxID=1392775 RepID=A0ABV5GCF5_9FLAO
MKKIFFLLLTTSFSIAQTQNQKVKVILLGTFHYGATSDKNSIKFDDLFSEKRQNELDSLAKRLKKIGVDKFFVEDQTSNQKEIESQLKLYKSKKITDEKILKDEIVQIAYRTASINNAKIVAVDFKQELPYDKINEYEKIHDKEVNPYSFFDAENPFTAKRKKLVDTPLMEYYIQMNNSYTRQALLYDYLHYALAYGTTEDYTGENFTASYYDRNLKIFTNILRNIDLKTDKTIVVLFGASHTSFLRQFFENHPYFEIVELETIFN